MVSYFFINSFEICYFFIEMRKICGWSLELCRTHLPRGLQISFYIPGKIFDYVFSNMAYCSSFTRVFPCRPTSTFFKEPMTFLQEWRTVASVYPFIYFLKVWCHLSYSWFNGVTSTRGWCWRYFSYVNLLFADLLSLHLTVPSTCHNCFYIVLVPFLVFGCIYKYLCFTETCL